MGQGDKNNFTYSALERRGGVVPSWPNPVHCPKRVRAISESGFLQFKMLCTKLRTTKFEVPRM